MTYSVLVQVFGGLGLFFFALRFLTNRFNQSASSRFRPLLDRLMANAPQGLMVGTASTALLQASSIVIVTIMGLVDSGLLSIEQGFFVMLGSTFGTTLKMWFFIGFVDFGPLLVGLGSIGLLFARRTLVREALQIMAAIGLAFVGLQMLVTSLGGLQQESVFVNLARSYLGDSLAQQTLLAFVGAGMAVALQSSSASILIFMGLAQAGSITVPVAAALVLGANLGTTSTALIVGFQADQNGKRIALAHFLCKLGGVFITLMLFPSFLSAVEWLTGRLLGTTEPVWVVAGVHSGFNLINMVWWSLLSVPILRGVAWVYPTKESKSLGLSKGVRRLLSRNPKRAFSESQEQFRQLELLVKNLYDHVFKILNEGANMLSLQARRNRLTRNFEALRETVHDLLFIVARGEPKRETAVLRTISMLEIYSSLSRTCFAFHDHLERGFTVEKYTIPDEVSVAIDKFRSLLDRLWLDVLLPEKSDSLEQLVIEGETLEQVVLSYNRTLGSGHQTYTSWLFELAGFMRAIAAALGGLGQLKERAHLELDEETRTEVYDRTELEEEPMEVV